MLNFLKVVFDKMNLNKTLKTHWST